jgi:hypothetical protein
MEARERYAPFCQSFEVRVLNVKPVIPEIAKSNVVTHDQQEFGR